MKLSEMYLSEFDNEMVSTRKTLERIPEDKLSWKPHEKSMPLGYLASLVARMPAWVAMMINLDELDMAPQGGSKFKPEVALTNRELLEIFDKSLAEGRDALKNTNDEHLLKPWRFKVAGNVVSENPRHIQLRDAVFSHLAHHRGQLTVYLRLNSAPVPSIYGPSADEGRF